MREFMEWLIEVRKISKASAKVYASRAKKVMAELPEDMGEAQVRDYLAGHVELRSAYRTYAEWAKEAKGLHLPTIDTFPVGRPVMQEKKAKPTIPDEVLDAILSLMEATKLPASTLKRIYWGQLTHVPKKARYDMPHPDYKNTWAMLPEREVDIIRAWAQPDDGALMLYPLVPKAPKSTVGAEWKTLTPTLAARKRSQPTSEDA